MIGLGTIINVAAIVAGGAVGLLGGKWLTEQCQETLTRAMGVCVLFISIAGAMEKMLSVENDSLTSGGTLMLIISIALGTVLGEIWNLDGKLESFGRWLRDKSGNQQDNHFLNGFITASMTVCIGAMAVVGAVQDGLYGDYSTLTAKALLDFIIIMVMASSMGKGCLFSAIPVGLFQGGVTLLARLIEPLMTDAALHNLSLVGSVLIFCVGMNLIWKNCIRVANMLPALLVAVAFAFIV